MKKKKNKLYTVEYRNGKIKILAKNRDEAFAKFFKAVKDKKIPLDNVGQVIILHNKKEKYPFRTAPLLWQMGIIDTETAVKGIMACTGVSQDEAELMLYKFSYNDSRLLPIILNLDTKGES